MHWVPTLSSPREVVDRFVRELADMHIKWVTFLNDATNIGANDYLVKSLVREGMMPVMRIFTPYGAPIEGDIKALVRHYQKLGVDYFQLYNEPNLALENGGQAPSVDSYLDKWIPAAKEVIEAGGLPGFGSLSPAGEFDDREFLSRALDGLKARGEEDLLDRAWLSIHNYTGPLPLDHPRGFSLFREYDRIVREKLGWTLPIISTEGGTQVSEAVSEAKQVEMVTQAFDHMKQREPYYLAYTYWIVANEEGGGHDPAFSSHALFYPGGARPLVAALKRLI